MMQTNYHSIVNKLPSHIWSKIYEYDSTYYEEFKNVLNEMQWIQFIRSINNLCFSNDSYMIYHIRAILLKKMYDIYPILYYVGFEPSCFKIYHSKWYFTKKNNKTNIYVDLHIEKLNPKLEKWAEDYTKNELEIMNIESIDDDDDITVDSEGNSNPLPSKRSSIYDSSYRYIASTIYETSSIKIYTSTNMRCLQIEFHDIGGDVFHV